MKIIQIEAKTCPCGSGLIPGFFPAREHTEPDEDGDSCIAGVYPAWFCPACGKSGLVLAEESITWLTANVDFFRRLVRVINIAERMISVCPELRELLDEEQEAHSNGKVH